MKKYLLLALSVILSISLSACSPKAETDKEDSKIPELEPVIAEKHNITAKDIMSLGRIADPQLSPDGNWVLYCLTMPDIEDNKNYKDLFAVSIDGKETKRLTSDTHSEYNARWSPDGSKIAFLSNRDSNAQIYTMDFPEGQPKQITAIEGGVGNMAWSPDGKMFSFTSDVKMFETVNDKYPEYPKANVRMYDKINIRHWDHWVDDKASHLFVIPASGGKALDLMDGQPWDTPLSPFGGPEEIAWSPDSKEITYTCKKVEDYAESTNSDLYVVPVNGGEAKNITSENPGYDKAPLYSPDGKWIAYTSLARPSFESDKYRLMLHNRQTGENHELSTQLDQWIQEPVWAPDSKSLYFSAGDSGKIKLFQMMVEDGSWNYIADGWYNHGGGLCLSADGNTLVYARQSMFEPVELFAQTLSDGNITKLTGVNDERMKYINKGTCEERWITSTDGKKVMCWIVFPPNFDATKKYPMISYCQGGPQAMIGQRFHYRWNYFLMASNDYVVLLPNRRGVPGFGQDWNDAISGDWGGMPMQDILAATDEMVKEDYVDNDGLCAVGASAGGYAAFWLAGNHEGRFKAFISHCGVFNMESMYGATEELFFPNWENGGPYWEAKNKAFYEKHSAHKYAQNWDTPIMITTGEYDFRVPYTQSLEAFTVAQVKDIPSKIMIFPEETHFIAHNQEFIIWANEFFGWLDRFTKK